ncbi:hypothetical protein TNCV_397151 [Trichonephila clavipes]|nr:hypothetical protein TNCV_397151 [Trichonephila clavipes]
MGCHHIQHTVTPDIDLQHHDSPKVCSRHSLATCVVMAGYPGAIYQQNNAFPLTSRVSQDYHNPIFTLPWPARSPDFSSI